MGLTKRTWMDQLEKGYTAPADLFVCQACLADQYLSEILDAASEEVCCSYCDSTSAAHISILIDEIMAAIREDFGDPTNELPYDSKEGGWQGSVYDNYEILDQLDHWTDRDDLVADVATALSEREWCRKDYFGLDKFQVLNYGWDRFKQQIIHRTRYLFMMSDEGSPYDGHGSIRPARMLERLCELFSEHRMFRTIDAGMNFVRARVTKRCERPSTAKELGTPDERDARYANRMSPAGIPMFYAALHKNTAIAETFDSICGNLNELAISLATFRTSRSLVLLDLVKLPSQPSCFDREKRHTIKTIRFLWNLKDDLTKPIDKDGREHVDYVPTQVITEYIRHQVKYGEKRKRQIDGIIYPSTKDNGGTSVVIFAESKNCGTWTDRKPHRSSKSSMPTGVDELVFLHLVDVERVYPEIAFRTEN